MLTITREGQLIDRRWRLHVLTRVAAMGSIHFEVHRTHTPQFHAGVQHEEDILKGILAKVEMARSSRARLTRD
jgi:hypothetical protein